MLDVHHALLKLNKKTATCIFNECMKEAVPGSTKCAFHKRRKCCSQHNCNNQAYARDLCVRHGGKRKCAHASCTTAAHGGPFCVAHGGASGKRLCSIEGCGKQAHANRRCVRHGGGRRCCITGCSHYARARGVCRSHGHLSVAASTTLTKDKQDETCAAEDVHTVVAAFLHTVVDDTFLEDLHSIKTSKRCLYPPQSGLDKCAFHKRRKKCAVGGCDNQVYARGLCVRHGGKKVCEYPNCDNNVYGGTLCPHHGGQDSRRFCVVKGCTRQARSKRRCVRHGGGRKCKMVECEHHARVSGFCLGHCRPLELKPEPIDLTHIVKESKAIDKYVEPIQWTNVNAQTLTFTILSPRSCQFILQALPLEEVSN
ncbi:hypothetical protein THRCLA_03230 [Thraustotheca clavata]|uniref:WRKY transcription factor 19 n=1 Tax=Thraustotheca clavata TaxID=74557 RepID=A0A1W0A2P0_9STRA|nr:hypothetical protein THRCLA_03230 [Thraustotheca clavata]